MRQSTTVSSLARFAVVAITAVGLCLGAVGVVRAQDPSPMSINVDEGGIETYTIRLNTAPTGMVTITPSITPAGGEVSVSGGITFTVTNWNVARTITVTAGQDSDADDDTATISHAVSGYGNITEGGPAVVTVFDDDGTPDFGTMTVAPQTYTVGSIQALTLPAAIRGTKPLSYTLTPATDIPAGLMPDLDARTLTGVPTTATAAVTLTWTVTDADANTAATDQDTLTVTFTVQANPAPYFGTAMVASQTYVTDRTIPILTLPEAAGGDGALSYALTGTLPAGLAYTTGTRTIAGMPSAAAPRSLYTWTATDSDGDTSSLTFAIVVAATDVCVRTPEVRDAIVGEIGGVGACTAVTPAHLRGITEIHIERPTVTGGVRMLQSGDFDGLSAMTHLLLNFNRLTTLPGDIFNGLSALTFLTLSNNQIRTLPTGLFDGLSKLTTLNLRANPGSPFTLNIDVEQQGNGRARARVLEAAPSDIEVTWTVPGPDGATGTVTIPAGRRTSETFGMAMASSATFTLSNPRFTGTEGLDFLGFQLAIAGTDRASVLTPASLTVSEGDTTTYSVWLNTAPTGNVTVTPSVAPTDSDVTVTGALTFTTATWHSAQMVIVTAGQDSNDADADDTATISHAVSGYGNITEGGPAVVTVFDDDGDTAPQFVATTVAPQTYTIGIFQALTLPAAIRGNGDLSYALSGTLPTGLTFDHDTRILAGTPPSFAPLSSHTWTATDSDGDVSSLVFTIAVPETDVCSRTSQVRDVIVATIDGVSTCEDVTRAHLRGITKLDSDLFGLSALQSGDFAGLSALTTLTLRNSGSLTTLPADIFAGLSALTTLNLNDNAFATLPEGLFAGLSALTTLNLGGNRFTTLPEGLFAGLSALTTLNLDDNRFTTLPADIFAGLSALTTLDLGGNSLTTLPADIFAGLSALTTLDLNRNAFATLPEGLFAGLSALTSLNLSGNAFATLPEGLFAGLSALTTLELGANSNFTTLPADIFAGLSALETLNLVLGQLTALPADIFAGLSALTTLLLSNNALAALPTGFFDGLGALELVTLGFNSGAPFTLNIDVEQQGNGQARARVLEAAPLAIEVTWTVSGSGGATGMVTIPAGRRTSESFGMAMASPASFTLSNPRFPDAPEDTSDNLGRLSGFQLAIADTDRASVLTPATLTVPESGTTNYSVWLNTAPTGNVIVTPSVTPMGSEVAVSGSALTFTTANWHSAQMFTVTAGLDSDGDDDTATISHAVSGYGDVTEGGQSVVIVFDAAGVPDFGTMTVAPQTYTIGIFQALTLPAASQGNGALAYALTPVTDIPAGLVPDLDARTLTGAPTTATTAVTLTWTVTDADANTAATDQDTLTVTFTVQANPGPYFGTTMVGTQVYVAGQTGPVLTLPEPAGGDGTLSYALTGTLPGGLTYITGTRTIAGMPSAAAPRSFYTWTAIDSDGDTGSLIFAIAVATTNVCLRTPEIRDTIVRISGVDNCEEVTAAHLNSLGRSFVVTGHANLRTLQSFDFNGFGNLQTLNLSGNGLTTLPSGLFLPPSLQSLLLANNQITTLPAGLLARLATSDSLTSQLQTLELQNNLLTTLPAGFFTGLDRLTDLRLQNNRLATLPGGLFAGLERLEELNLRDNALVTLPADFFSGFEGLGGTTSVVTIDLIGNALAVLPSGLFSGLGQNRPVSIAMRGRFQDLGEVDGNQIESLPVGLFDDMPPVRNLIMNFNPGSPFTLNVFPTPVGDGRFQMHIQEAAPVDVLIDWGISGGATGTVTVPAGRRDSEPFGTTMTSPDAFTFSNPRFVDLPDNGNILGFALAVSGLRDGINAAPVALNVPEGNTATYTVWLSSAPTSPVTVTPNVGPAGSDVTVAGTLTFTASNWYLGQPLTVATDTDNNNTNETATITHATSDYATDDRVGRVVVTVTDTNGVPSFGTTMVSNQNYREGDVIPTLTLPEATGGDGTLSYALTGSLPAGLSFTAGTFTLTGTPTMAMAVAVTLTWTVVDTDANTGADDTDSLTFTVAVTDTNSVPSFGTATVRDETYTIRAVIPTLTLPEATGGDGARSYALTGGIPDGLIFDATTRTLAGVPTTVAPAVTLTYTVTDTDADEATLTFAVTITPAVPGVTITRTALTVNEGDTATYTVLLATEPAGNVTFTPKAGSSAVTVTIAPTALTFSVANWEATRTVTVTTAADNDTNNDTATITHTVSGYGAVTTAAAVTVIVNDTNGVPSFDTVMVRGETYTIRAVIPTLTLPEATGGDGALNYTLTGGLPDGLAFDATTRTLAGIPTTVAPAVTLTYTVTDTDANEADTDEATLTFAVTITPAVPGVTITRTALTVNEGDTATYTVLLATEPAGNVTFTPKAGSSAVTVTIAPTALTFSVANWEATRTVTVTTAADNDTNNDTATITHTVSGYGAVTTAAAVTVIVNDTNGVPSFDTVMVRGETYTIRAVIPTLTLPEATGGDGALNYALTGGLPDGLAFDATTRTLAGIPTTVAPAVTLTYTVTDTDANEADTDEATLTFAVTITPAVPGVTITRTALTVNEGDTATYTVLLATEPAGNVTFTPKAGSSAVTVTIAPTALTFSVANWEATRTVTVTTAADNDTNNDTATITHTVSGYGAVTTAAAVTVIVNDTNGVPSFDTATVRGETYTIRDVIPTLTLPEATGGDGALNYALTGGLPDGLAFDATTRTLTGIPTTVAPAVTLTYTVTDTDANEADTDEATLTFAVTITPAVPGVTITRTALTVNEGDTARYTVLLATVPAGDVTVTPASGSSVVTVPGALTFSVANWNTVHTVAVSAVVDDHHTDDTSTITHAVSGYGSVTTAAAVTVTVIVTNSVPTFGTTAVTDQLYATNTAIRALTLPEAVGGDGELSYTLTGLPDGLTFASTMRTLTGTPTTATAAVTLTYTVMDADDNTAAGDTDVLTLVVTVEGGNTKAGMDDLNRVILPEVARAMADQRVNVISQRIRQGRTDASGSARSVTVGGQSTLAGMLTTHGRTIADGNFDLKTLLGGSNFVLPLNASGVGPASMLSGVTLWGGGDYRALSGKDDTLDWNGGLVSGHLGADARLSDELLAGLAVSWSQVDLDYNDPTDNRIGLRGDYEVDLTTVHPYVGWTALGGRLDLWATAGYGWGELEITSDDQSIGQLSSDVTTQTVGAGGSGQMLKHGGTTLRVKGEALHTSMDVEESAGMNALTVDARRMRLGLEASHTHTLADGRQLVPTVEVGMRHDAGDGRTGTGAEVGGKFRYSDPANGLTVESHGRVLLGHTGDYTDWGLGGIVKLETGQGGRGLSFSLQPTWGATASRAAQVWAQAPDVTVPAAGAAGQRNGQMDLNLGYGMGWDEMLVTPYGRMTLTNGPARSYRVGSRMQLSGRVTLNLEGTREETAARLVNHGIRLQLGLGNQMTFSLEGTRQQTTAQALNHGINLQVGMSF